MRAARIHNLKTNERTEVPATAMFVAIGHQPNTGLFKGVLDLNEAGYIKTVPGSTRTNIAIVCMLAWAAVVVPSASVRAAARDGGGSKAAAEAAIPPPKASQSRISGLLAPYFIPQSAIRIPQFPTSRPR